VGGDVGAKDEVGATLVVGDEDSVGDKVGAEVPTEVGNKDKVGTEEKIKVGD